MRTNIEHISSTKWLLIQWLALWRAAYACGRAMNMFAKFNPARATEEAEQLELWSRFALFTLLGQIAALPPPQTQEDAAAISRLHALAGAFAGLCLLAAKVKRESAGRVLALADISLFSVDAADRYAEPPGPDPGFNDSS